ncbi:hypothetical protein [Sunxiuqinia indica]|uniref:hypothetical protein n=1 Tax=Sunxiuqinia indica TaxID=2692584 RepID=UPI001357FE7F|nr:hypothetical protein [Sunxiuqinia indica]
METQQIILGAVLIALIILSANLFTTNLFLKKRVRELNQEKNKQRKQLKSMNMELTQANLDCEFEAIKVTLAQQQLDEVEANYAVSKQLNATLMKLNDELNRKISRADQPRAEDGTFTKQNTTS